MKRLKQLDSVNSEANSGLWAASQAVRCASAQATASSRRASVTPLGSGLSEVHASKACQEGFKNASGTRPGLRELHIPSAQLTLASLPSAYDVT